MQYLLNTALYMLEPSEIKLFNFILVFLLTISMYSTYIFLPSQIMRMIQWLNPVSTYQISSIGSIQIES